MTSFDQTTRLLFENTPVRGELTQLSLAYQDVLSKHSYPTAVKNLLGEFMVAAAMLSDTIKFEGTLSLQVRGTGQVRTLMAECRNNSDLRAIAQYNDDFDPTGAVLGEGQMGITIEPNKGHRYQGIVTINDDDLSLATVLEDYFQKSEQIRTKIWLFANGHTATGHMLQAMPESASVSSLDMTNQEDWSRIVHLASTLTSEEALTLSTQSILHRLYHEETVRLYEPRHLRFKCTCSDQRSANAVITLGKEDALKLAHEKGFIEIDCHFCRQHYAFSADDVEALFNIEPDASLN